MNIKSLTVEIDIDILIEISCSENYMPGKMNKLLPKIENKMICHINVFRNWKSSSVTSLSLLHRIYRNDKITERPRAVSGTLTSPMPQCQSI